MGHTIELTSTSGAYKLRVAPRRFLEGDSESAFIFKSNDMMIAANVHTDEQLKRICDWAEVRKVAIELGGRIEELVLPCEVTPHTKTMFTHALNPKEIMVVYINDDKNDLGIIVTTEQMDELCKFLKEQGHA